ncbi:MAG TPA: hypothetical protein DIT97_05065 [Gimesia maris]|uniref:Uncharacterized protein n=1 Tax=Gimesia maris TaxID=122 RepID=A0A3D3R374_9PLAN|nr:hypothetical protein [Gimesia maris]|tara:strand:- start:1280 stop:1900 length:621 start_codon:yes stop_codon:yes gene_type:complete
MNKYKGVEGINQITEAVFYCREKWEMERSCIEGSALLAKVLRRLGYSNAYLLTVHIQINNGALQRWADENGISDVEVDVLECEIESAFQIQIGKGVFSADRWPGHLVVVVPAVLENQHVVIDMTILQANLPDRNIIIEDPVTFYTAETFVTGETLYKFDINNARFIYEAYPEDKSYNDDHDCMELDGIDEAESYVLKLLFNESVSG